MKRNPTLLAAVDRSTQAVHVIRYAIDLAVRLKGELHVLYVDALHDEPYDKQMRIQRERMVREQIKARGAEGHIVVKFVSERDVTPAPGIIRYGRDNHCDMVVMGTHGRRGVRALVLGSVAHEVIRFASSPVFTVTGEDDEFVDIGMLSRILIPLDFSRHAVGALKYAREFAARLGASLELVHVVEDTFHPAFYGPFHQSIYDVNPDIEDIAYNHIVKLLERTGGVPDGTHIDVFRGHPARDIPRWASEHGSELIVMATHGLTGMQHLFMGSVAERTVQLAPCPVVTIHVDLLPHVESELMEDFEVAVV